MSGFLVKRLEFLWVTGLGHKRAFVNVGNGWVDELAYRFSINGSSLNEALFNGERWHARWIRVRGTSAIFTAMGLHRIGSLAKKVAVIWKAT